MRNASLRRPLLQGGIVVLITLSLVSSCDMLPAAPSVVPSPIATSTPHVVVYTATPSPTRVPTPTIRPTVATPSPTPPPPTATASPSPTVSATVPLTATLTPSVSPSPTESPYQLEVWVAPPDPIVGSSVTVYGQFTHLGQGVPQAWVYVICQYRARRVRYPQSGFEKTDDEGVGRVGFDIMPAAAGETVLVDVYVQHEGREYRAQTSFQPRQPTPRPTSG